MKKRARTQQNVPFYSNEPAVSRTLIADQSLTQNASLGGKPPKMVDKTPGRLSGAAGFASKSKPPAKATGVTIPKLGTKASKPSQQGNLRMSGHGGAHRIGQRLPKLKSF